MTDEEERMDGANSWRGYSYLCIAPNNLMLWEQTQEIMNANQNEQNVIFSFNNNPMMNWRKEVQIMRQRAVPNRCLVKIRYCMPRGRKIRSRGEMREIDENFPPSELELLDFTTVYCVCHGKWVQNNKIIVKSCV